MKSGWKGAKHTFRKPLPAPRSGLPCTSVVLANQENETFFISPIDRYIVVVVMSEICTTASISKMKVSVVVIFARRLREKREKPKKNNNNNRARARGTQARQTGGGDGGGASEEADVGAAESGGGGVAARLLADAVCREGRAVAPSTGTARAGESAVRENVPLRIGRGCHCALAGGVTAQ